MNRNIRNTFFTFFAIGFLLFALYLLLPPTQETSVNTVTPTVFPATSTSTNTYFVAFTNLDNPCRLLADVLSEVITTIPQQKNVMVIGKNEQGDWLLVRWGVYSDCWIERRFVTSYDIDKVAIIVSPTLPNNTPTLITTITSSPTPSKTRVRPGYTPPTPTDSDSRRPNSPTATKTWKPSTLTETPKVATATDTPKVPTSTHTLKPPTPTNTSKPPSDTPKPLTDTPKPPSDTPKPPTDTPKPPSDTPEPPTPCKNPNNPKKCPSPTPGAFILLFTKDILKESSYVFRYKKFSNKDNRR